MTFSDPRQSVSRWQVRAAGAVDTAPTALGSQEPILPRFLESIHTGVDIFSTGEHRIHELYVTVGCLRAEASTPFNFRVMCRSINDASSDKQTMADELTALYCELHYGKGT